MFENDYVMRMIKEMVRTLIKLIFQIDTEKTEELHLEKEVAEELDRLQKLVDDGLVNQAENELLEELDIQNKQDFQLALVFYEYLNQKDTDFLKAYNFSREEISQGIRNVTEMYGYGSMLGAFAEEETL